MCVCVRERESVCESVCERERRVCLSVCVRERKSVSVSESVSVRVCV